MDPRNRAPQDPARSGCLHRRTFEDPETVKQELIAGVRAHLGPDYDVATHFTPTYRPWRQRLAFVPDGDLFQGIRSGKASVVTDEIERFTETGILLKSGTAARSRHRRHGDRLPPQCTRRHRLHHRRQAARLLRHGHLSRHDVHRRAQHGVGLRIFPRQLDVAGRSGRRLRLPAAQSHEAEGRTACHAGTPTRGQGHAIAPWIDPENFNPGYVLRGMHLLPKRGNTPEWQHSQDYWSEKDQFPAIDLDDTAFVYA